MSIPVFTGDVTSMTSNAMCPSLNPIASSQCGPRRAWELRVPLVSKFILSFFLLVLVHILICDLSIQTGPTRTWTELLFWLIFCSFLIYSITQHRMPPRVFPYFNFLRLSSPAEIYCLYDLIWPSSQYLQFKMYSLKIWYCRVKGIRNYSQTKKKVSYVARSAFGIFLYLRRYYFVIFLSISKFLITKNGFNAVYSLF